ncbi:MAG TPA: amidohydrolase family protein [Stellaceae bacterium]|jgi:predicted TIM-barrel fold metal-dependent hydrolase|nr:amidohydrolase family protein [Stellaceae bacterium]
MAPTKLIDVHAHILPDYYTQAVTASGRAPSISAGFPRWSAQAQIEMMDRLEISATINSISQPGVHFGDDAAARALARRCNETFAEMAAGYPQRFGSFAVLPLPDVAGAVKEIEYALATLKLDGVGLLASYGEAFLSDPEFVPVLEALDHHGATVFVHPNFHPRSRGIQKDLAGFLVEFPIDTTRAALGLVFSGAVERYARIRFILAHAGGALPYLSWRVSLASMIDQRYAAMTRERVMAQIGRFYFDLAQASGPQVLACLNEITTPDRILFGSDWPYCDEKVGQATVDAVVGNAQGPRFGGAFRENALALFPRLRGE